MMVMGDVFGMHIFQIYGFKMNDGNNIRDGKVH